jgi:drug/metabolite transporter (DMT)-like permease
VYVIWGSTYLALAFLVDEFPPLTGNAIRFALAGTLLAVIARRRGRPWPTRIQWRGAAQVGLFLLLGGVSMVATAQSLGVGSGLAAMGVAIVPLWTGLWAGLFGQWPNRVEWFGLALGFLGMLILSGEGDFDGNPWGIALLVASPISWAFGSVWSSRVVMPEGIMSTAAQMLAAAPVILVVGLVSGERFDAVPDMSGWLALLYLAIPGSVVALTAYTYLLQNVRPALATSYAYVNPVVAVILGVTIGGEVLSGRALIALPIILAAVGLVLMQRARTSTPVDVEETPQPPSA